MANGRSAQSVPNSSLSSSAKETWISWKRDWLSPFSDVKDNTWLPNGAIALYAWPLLCQALTQSRRLFNELISDLQSTSSSAFRFFSSRNRCTTLFSSSILSIHNSAFRFSLMRWGNVKGFTPSFCAACVYRGSGFSLCEQHRVAWMVQQKSIIKNWVPKLLKKPSDTRLCK